MNSFDLQSFLTTQCSEMGFSHFGHTKLAPPLSLEFYKNWLAQGQHGDMNYLEQHLPIKADHRQKYPRAKSALLFAVPYFPHPDKKTVLPIKQARISLYAQGGDYHFWFTEKLKKISALLLEKFPQEEFLSLADSSPVLERDLAYRGGLGWFGKNTCLIHPKKGSLFFIGEILTSLELENTLAPLPDFCGTCRRCIEICPTGALSEGKNLDARKCISFLTIESKSVPPLELREKIGDWLFGCDLCQTICPWNEKIFKGQLETLQKRDLTPHDKDLLKEDLQFILNSSGKELARRFHGTALARAGSFGLKRNAIVVATNQKIYELVPEIQKMSEHPKLKELVEWSLAKLKT